MISSFQTLFANKIALSNKHSSDVDHHIVFIATISFKQRGLYGRIHHIRTARSLKKCVNSSVNRRQTPYHQVIRQQQHQVSARGRFSNSSRPPCDQFSSDKYAAARKETRAICSPSQSIIKDSQSWKGPCEYLPFFPCFPQTTRRAQPKG